MYESLQQWLKYPMQLRRYIGMSSAADRLFDEAVDFLGYYVGQMQVVNTANAREVTSSSQVYYDPTSISISENDQIIVSGKAFNVITSSSYFDGNTASMSIGVAYL